MKKKELKWYEAPLTKVIELELQGIICGSSNLDPDDSTEGGW